MSIFDKLPNVTKCCFCFDLKLGCLFIGITYLFFMVQCFAVDLTYYGDDATYFKDCNHKTLINIFRYIRYVVLIAISTLSILFIYAVLYEKRDIMEWFMWGLLFNIIFQLLYGIIMSTTGLKCMLAYNACGTSFVGIFLDIYFLCVVKSYQSGVI